jgi:hypothetical protein
MTRRQGRQGREIQARIIGLKKAPPRERAKFARGTAGLALAMKRKCLADTNKSGRSGPATNTNPHNE